MKRIILAALALFAVAALPASAAPGGVLPDLVIVKPSQSEIRLVTEGGRRLLRYSGTVRNVGGAFELNGLRQSVSEEPVVSQRVYQADGSSFLRATSAVMFWSSGSDGHEHWHVRDFMLGQLYDRAGNLVGRLSKVGFCFFDSQGPTGQSLPTYTAFGCVNPNSLSITMGLSNRWVDEYGWFLPGQFVDVTGLPTGKYTLRISVNESLGFLDADSTNNAIQVPVRL